MVSILSKKNIQISTPQIKTSIKKNSFLSRSIRFIKNNIKQLIKNILLSKYFHLLFKITVLILTLLSIFYGAYVYINNSVKDDIVVSKSEIVARVAKLTPVPAGNPDAVVRVEDPEILKKQNDFYENVKSGDYIVMYPTIAIIYDLMNNSIVSVKKVEKP